MSNQNETTVFIDPFADWAFKRLFASEESKPILIGLLNHIFKGKKCITNIEYGKTDYPGEHAEEGGAVFDITCTDADGTKFIIEIQRGWQENFIERGLFYISRAISDQAPKGNRKGWAYDIKEVYLIAFLEDFRLPGTPKSEYIQNICLANRKTGEIFYDKMSLIFIEMLNFVKKPEELDTDLDRWLYALKHLTEFEDRPDYLTGPEFDQLFNLAEYANLTREEREMYNASMKYKWDNQNVRDYAAKKGREEGLEQGLQEGLQQGLQEGLQEGLEAGERKKAVEMARKMLLAKEPLEKITEYSGLSIEEIKAL
jgi:predicted transposase/invertase (TIGR01784 family)